MQVLLTAILRCGEYSALGLGFGLIFATTGIFHFAFGTLFALTAYGILFFVLKLSLPFSMAAILGGVLAIGASLVVQIVFYEPLLRRPNPLLPLLITSLGLFAMMGQALSLPFGFQAQELPPHLRQPQLYHWGAATLTDTQMIGFGIEVLSVAAVLLFLNKTKFGLVIRAIGSDGDLAETLGANLRAARVLVMAIGTAISGIAAIGITLSVGVVTMSFPLNAALAGSIAAFFGGVGHPLGPLMGGIVLAFSQVLVSGLISGTWSDALVYAALLALILYRPRGLMGSRIGTLE